MKEGVTSFLLLFQNPPPSLCESIRRGQPPFFFFFLGLLPLFIPVEKAERPNGPPFPFPSSFLLFFLLTACLALLAGAVNAL